MNTNETCFDARGAGDALPKEVADGSTRQPHDYRLVENHLRVEWARTLAFCLGKVDEDDGATICSAYLDSIRTSGPALALFNDIRGEAEIWADCARMPELEAVTLAGLRRLGEMALGTTTRKRLFETLWDSFTDGDRQNLAQRIGMIGKRVDWHSRESAAEVSPGLCADPPKGSTDGHGGCVRKTFRHVDDMPPPLPPEAYRVEFPEQVYRCNFTSAATLHNIPLPARSWLVEGLVPRRTVTILGGDGGTGKSLLALQLAVSTTLGKLWLARTTTGGATLFISAEDDMAEIHRRLTDIVAAEGVTLADLDRLTIRSLAGEDALLARSDGRTGALAPSGLYRELEAYMAASAPALVILDTLADLFPGNENDRAQARQFVGLLRGLAIRHDCAVVLLAHPSLSGLTSGSGMSGSTAWNNSVRSRLYLERIRSEGYEADPDARVLRVMKMNYSRSGEEIALRWQSGVFVAEAEESGLDRMARGAKAERVFLKLLRLFNEQDRYVSPSKSVSYAPTVFSKHPEAEGVGKHALATAMEYLLRSGAVGIANHGRGASIRKHLEVVT